MHSFRRIATPLGRVALLTVLALACGLAQARETAPVSTVGTLKVERHGDRGQPVILIPGLEGGSWVWQQTIDQLQQGHVVYAVTLAGFDGTPAPKDSTHLLDQADASLLQLIQQQKIAKPVLVGHSIGGTLSLRFAGEHPQLLAGVMAVDGLPVFPGTEHLGTEQRQQAAARMQAQMSAVTPAQFSAFALGYMQHIGVIDQQLAAQYAPMNARSDIKATAEYMAEDMALDQRALLKNANTPIMVISPYNAPDFSQPPMQMSEQQKTAYYQSLLADAPNAKVVSISPSRHFVMFDQPQKFQQALDRFLSSL
jgi:pimeloyl-ACP methyl ester carboxylesterase